MPTLHSVFDDIGGVFDKGAGYLLLMEWHLEATGATWHEPTSLAWSAGTPPAVHFTPTVQLMSNQHREFHYRFIAIPNPLILNNPPYGSDIPWRLWNTFPSDDTVITATISGSNVITSDFAVAADIRDFEYKEFNIQVQEGEVEIDAELFGDFTQGDFTLDITGVVVLTIDHFPVDATVKEKWKWNTKVIVGWDSTEQRVRYAPAPIRTMEAEYHLDEPQIVDLQYRLYNSSVSTLAVPFWQYQFRMNAPSLAATNEVYFDPSYTNLKAGDRLYIISEKAAITPVVSTVEAMLPNGCRINSTLPQALEIGYVGCPMHSVYANDPQFSMDMVTGNFRMNGEVTDRGRTPPRDDITETLSLFNTIPVLDYKVLAGIVEGYEISFEDLASPFGKRKRSVIWTEPKLLRSVSFKVNNKKTMSGYDYATLFFDYCAGQHKPFYMSSRLEDLVLDSDPPNGASEIEVDYTIYADIYFLSNVYKQLEIEYEDGTYEWFNVNTAAGQVGGTTIITLATALPGDVATNKISRISYLYRVRLATDEVSLSFRNNRVQFSFSILGTTQ